MAEEARGLIDRANQGDQEALAILKDRSRNWNLDRIALIGFTRNVRDTLASSTVPEQQLYSAFCLRRESEVLAQDLAGPNPTPLERLLAEQISVNWLALRSAEVLHEAAGKVSLEIQPQFQHRIDSAHRRFMASIRTLAQVRRLQIPNLVQVNIAEQTVQL